MIKCDGCDVGLSSPGIDILDVTIGGEAGQVSVLVEENDGLVDVEDRDLCSDCTAKWVIKLLGPVVNPVEAENKD